MRHNSCCVRRGCLQARAEEDEFLRAQERLTLKHRNTSRWARRALKRGLSLANDGEREALQEQLRLSRELRAKAASTQDGSDADGRCAPLRERAHPRRAQAMPRLIAHVGGVLVATCACACSDMHVCVQHGGINRRGGRRGSRVEHQGQGGADAGHAAGRAGRHAG